VTGVIPSRASRSSGPTECDVAGDHRSP
jgi:hypothetical protein